MRAEMLARLDLERRTLAPPGATLESRGAVTRLRPAEPGGWCGVIWSALAEADVLDAIAAEVAHHRALGVPFEWKVYAHDQPPALRERLGAAGFAIGPLEAVMVRALDAELPALEASEVGVREIHDAAGLAAYAAIERAVFASDPDGTIAELAAGLAAGSTGVLGYLAEAGGRVVGAARLYTSAESWFGGLYGGGTLPEARGRGVYRALIAARARRARELGARYLLVDALPTSRPILERLGFWHLTDTWACEGPVAPPDR